MGIIFTPQGGRVGGQYTNGCSYFTYMWGFQLYSQFTQTATPLFFEQKRSLALLKHLGTYSVTLHVVAWHGITGLACPLVAAIMNSKHKFNLPCGYHQTDKLLTRMETWTNYTMFRMTSSHLGLFMAAGIA